MDDQLWAVALDDGPSTFLTEHVHQVRPSLQGSDCCKVRSSCVKNTTSKHCDPPALSLVQLLGQPWNNWLHFLQHLGLLRTDGGSFLTSGKKYQWIYVGGGVLKKMNLNMNMNIWRCDTVTVWPVFEVCIAAAGFVGALCRGHADITGAALHRYLPGLGL